MFHSDREALRQVPLKGVRSVSLKNGALHIRSQKSQQTLLFPSQAEAEAAVEEWVSGTPEEAFIRALLKESDETRLFKMLKSPIKKPPNEAQKPPSTRTSSLHRIPEANGIRSSGRQWVVEKYKGG